jgi:hypothetical protein
MAELNSESAVASNAILRNAGGRQIPTPMTGSLIDLPPLLLLGHSTFQGAARMLVWSGVSEHSPETRNPEPLRKLAYPIGVFECLTIDATLSFVNRGGCGVVLNDWVSGGVIAGLVGGVRRSVYISISSVTATYGSALTAGYFEKRKVTKRSCP